MQRIKSANRRERGTERGSRNGDSRRVAVSTLRCCLLHLNTRTIGPGVSHNNRHDLSPRFCDFNRGAAFPATRVAHIDACSKQACTCTCTGAPILAVESNPFTFVLFRLSVSLSLSPSASFPSLPVPLPLGLFLVLPSPLSPARGRDTLLTEIYSRDTAD